MRRRPVKHCRETRRRIRLAVAAYAYEFEDDPVMTDAEFDRIAMEIDPDAPTGNLVLDKFFMLFFEPATGMWVRNHPDIPGLKRLYETYYRADTDPDCRDLI